jgi:hypothetical protein
VLTLDPAVPEPVVPELSADPARNPVKLFSA